MNRNEFKETQKMFFFRISTFNLKETYDCMSVQNKISDCIAFRKWLLQNSCDTATGYTLICYFQYYFLTQGIFYRSFT